MASVILRYKGLKSKIQQRARMIMATADNIHTDVINDLTHEITDDMLDLTAG